MTAPATDDDIAKIAERLKWLHSYSFEEISSCYFADVPALIARLDLEVAARKDDAERIKGLEAALMPVKDGDTYSRCRLCCEDYITAVPIGVHEVRRRIKHKPDCLLYREPT